MTGGPNSMNLDDRETINEHNKTRPHVTTHGGFNTLALSQWSQAFK